MKNTNGLKLAENTLNLMFLEIGVIQSDTMIHKSCFFRTAFFARRTSFKVHKISTQCGKKVQVDRYDIHKILVLLISFLSSF